MFSFILFCTYSRVYSQVSIFVDNIYQHEIIADSLSGKKYIINQKTFDIKGKKLFLETNYDPVTHLEKNTVEYFYDSLDRLTSREIQSIAKKPIELFQIFYNQSNDTSLIKIYVGKDNTIVLSGKKEFYYDGMNRLITILQSDSNDKLDKKTAYTYKSINPKPFSKTVQSYSPKVCKQKFKYSYADSANYLKSTQVKDGCKNALYKKYRIEYDYNKMGQLISEKKILNDGKVIWSRIYQYSNDIDLSTFYDINENNKIVSFYSRTFFWHKISFLNLKSFFEEK